MPEHKLNIKQKLFCDLYTDSTNLDYCGNATKCYQEIYNITDYKTAQANSSRMLSNDIVKDYIATKNKSVTEILEQNRNKLIQKAIDMSVLDGNASVLNKLLDKIAPSLAENHNTNANESIDDKIKSLINNLANKADSSQKQLPEEEETHKTA